MPPKVLQEFAKALVNYLVLPDFVVEIDGLAGSGDEQVLEPVVVRAEPVELMGR